MAATGETNEDLMLTPAERAAKRARTEAPSAAPSAEEEARLFGTAPEMSMGEGGDTIIIIGAGLVGSLAAVVLLRKGFKVHVFERYQDIRAIPSVGRSINLSVTSRGLRAIRSLGGSLHDDLMKLATKIMGRIIHMPDGKVIFQRYGKDDSECNYSVSRVELNKFLINAAADAGAAYHFDHALSETSDFTGEDLVGSVLHMTRGVEGSNARERIRIRAHCPVIACDGGGSRVRYALRRAGLTDFSEEILTRGYKEVLFPNPGEGNDFGAKGEDGGEACKGGYGLHIWPRGDHFLMALANVDGSFTGTIYAESKGQEESFETFTDTPEGREKCMAFVDKHYSEAAPLVGGRERLVDQIVKNPNGILGTVTTETWAVQGKVMLIGDSSHAMVPFFGQGCNCGFEDVLWLSRLLEKHCCEGAGQRDPSKCTGENFAACFKALQEERKPNAEAICAMAIENFVEMREKTGDLRFQLLKKVENQLENRFGSKFRSRYAMVCYGGAGNVSYSNAKSLGLTQWDILEELVGEAKDLTNEEAVLKRAAEVDFEAASRLIDERLVPRHRELGIDLSTVKH